jgi:glyoxylate carboligase
VDQLWQAGPLGWTIPRRSAWWRPTHQNGEVGLSGDYDFQFLRWKSWRWVLVPPALCADWREQQLPGHTHSAERSAEMDYCVQLAFGSERG